MKQETRADGGSPIFGVFVLGAGIVLLLNVLGVLSWEIWSDLWRWWPLLLVLAGAGMVFKQVHPIVMTLVAAGAVTTAVALSWATADGRIGPYNTVTSSFSEPLGSATSATFDLDFGAGSLEISALPAASSLLVDAAFEDREDGVRTRVERSGDEVRISLRNPSGISWLGPSGGQRNWDVQLSRDLPVDINIDGGASSYVLDLQDINSTEINLNIGASSLNMTLPNHSEHTEVRVSAGAASIEITVPEGVAAKIRVDSGLSSVEIDEARFPKDGRDHVSPGYETATNRANIVINAGVSSISVR